MVFDYALKKYYQKKVEHQYGRIFEGFLRTLHEPTIKETFKRAAPYVPDSFEGETVLSVGKSVDFALRGAAGIVSLVASEEPDAAVAVPILGALAAILFVVILLLSLPGLLVGIGRYRLIQ